MTNSDYIIGIEEINDIKAFFESLLLFFAPIDVIFTTWGRLPSKISSRLASCKGHTSWLRRIFSHENNWHLNNETARQILNSLCDDIMLDKFTWGIRKGPTSLGLCRAWDDIDIHGSDLIEEAVLYKWLEELKLKVIIESYEVIKD